MNQQPASDVTQLLARLGHGDPAVAERLMPMIYDELRAVARRQLHGERERDLLQTTALAHEAWLRIAGGGAGDWDTRARFFGLAAHVIRNLLVDFARQRNAERRGAGWKRVALDDELSVTSDGQVDLLALDEALAALAQLDERQAKVVEMRFFGGLSVEEVARVLGVSPRTVKGEWAMARAWLRHKLAEGAP